MREKEEETTRRRKASLYTCVPIFILTQVTYVLVLTSFMQQNPIPANLLTPMRSRAMRRPSRRTCQTPGSSNQAQSKPNPSKRRYLRRYTTCEARTSRQCRTRGNIKQVGLARVMPLPRSLANIKREISEKKWAVGLTTKRSTACQRARSPMAQ
jgi:hypothetical protein